jgi:hypothetical protein
LRQILAPVERAIIAVELGSPRLRQHRHFISGMQIQQRLLAASRRKAHPQTASCRHQFALILDV